MPKFVKRGVVSLALLESAAEEELTPEEVIEGVTPTHF